MKLDMSGIAVSFGAACSSGTPKASNVLLDVGLTNEQALKTIRISIGNFHNKKDIVILAETISEILKSK